MSRDYYLQQKGYYYVSFVGPFVFVFCKMIPGTDLPLMFVVVLL